MRADFRLGDWIVRPRRDCVECGDETVHIHPKPMAVLEYLAAAGGEVVTRDELFDSVWPGVIVTDDALTQCIVELRKALGDSAQNAKIIKTIPKVGFCLIPPVVFLTEELKVSDEPPGKTQSGQPRSNRALIGAVLSIIVVILLISSVLKYLDGLLERGNITIANATPSIAVLPFTDLSENGDQEWFADGLSEELINMLARVEGLKVTNRTSSFYFRGTNERLRVIADTLDVSHILEGSVRKDKDQLRVTAQLIDASSGYQLWSEAYDRELESAFAVQQEISRAVVNALKENPKLERMTSRFVIATTANQAHDALLLGRYLIAKRTQSDIEDAVLAFEDALEIDPDYAIAHAELALAVRLLRYYGEGITLAEAKTRVRRHAEQALALDPDIAEAYAALAWVQEEPNEAIAHYKQAIKINPSYAMAYTWVASSLINTGRYREAFSAYETAIRLDPLSIPAIINYIRQLVSRSQLDKAERELAKLAYLGPGTHARIQGGLKGVGGRYSQRALSILDALKINPGDRLARRILAQVLAAMNLEEESLALQDTPQLKVLKILGKVDDALKHAEANLTWYSEAWSRRRDLGSLLAMAGDYTQARPILESVWKQSKGRVAMAGFFGCNEAAALIAIHRAVGEETEVGELLMAMRKDVQRLRAAGMTGTRTFNLSADYQEGLTAFLSGKREEGLNLIAEAVEKGFFILPNEAYLQTLYSDPGFAPILAVQQARQARERKNFLTNVCTDSLYADVWQPAVGTCERLAAEGGI